MKQPYKDGTTKIYCERCDKVFGSRETFDQHFDQHDASPSCEMCPIDAVLSRVLRLFRRSRDLE